MAAQSSDNDGNLVYVIGLIAGGLTLGFGVRSLYGSFGWPGGPLNGEGAFKSVGFSGIDNIALLPPADYSIGMVVAGVLVLVVLNASAWKRTGGY